MWHACNGGNGELWKFDIFWNLRFILLKQSQLYKYSPRDIDVISATSTACALCSNPVYCAKETMESPLI